MNPQINIFPDINQLAAFFAGILIDKIKSLDRKRKLTLSLSGGSTPAVIFKYLSGNFASKVNWSQICFFFGDERCVPPDHPESNFKMVYENLFQFIDVPEENIFRIRGENDPDTAALEYSEQVIDKVPHRDGIPSFDLCLLGLGEDGHTASIFPGDIHLFETDTLYAVTRHPVTSQKRITATGKLLNNSGTIFFLVTGKQKADVVRQIFLHKEESKHYPAALIRPKQGNLFWLLDQQAALFHYEDLK